MRRKKEAPIPELMSATEAARWLGVSVRTVQRMLKLGQLRRVPILGQQRGWACLVEDVEALVNKKRVKRSRADRQ